jgi:membrane-associated protease RseP (regulator of RpoE activity)
MNERLYQNNPITVEYKIKGDEPARVTTRPPSVKQLNIRTHILLFIATLFTTTLAGALMEASPNIPFWPQLYKGLPFSLTLLTILLFHEFGHYFMARKHRVDATLPYFIPAPPPFILGTFGAVIKMRSPVSSKRALFDIGVAGPLSGVLVAIPAIVVGLRLSEVRVASELTGGLHLGSSLLFLLLSRISVGLVPEGHDIVLHSIAFAGWIGLLVTMINLLPVGQLDGGHVTYAVFGRRWHAKIVSVILPLLLIIGCLPIPQLLVEGAIELGRSGAHMWVASFQTELELLSQLLVEMVFRVVKIVGSIWIFPFRQSLEGLAGYGWMGWLIWYVLLRYVIKVTHPPTRDEQLPLGRGRMVLGWVTLGILVLTFTPAPFIIKLL